jgi:NNP family nitrate/nitrite transporter-like MFS transporter
MADALRATGGAVFALVARVTPQPQAGSVTDIVGAVCSAKDSYSIGFMLLSDLALAGCVHAYDGMRDPGRTALARPVPEKERIAG